MYQRLMLIGVVVVVSMLGLAAGLNGLALAQGPAPQGDVGVQAVMGAGFTYQGQLLQGGSAVSGTCTFQFGLWNAASGGGQLGVTRTLALSVTGGLFTATPDFTGGAGGVANAFDGEARWLGIRVDCGSGYASLGRQALTPAPYALALPGLWTQPNITSPNLIGGYSGNSVNSGVVGAVIGGGGNSDYPNRVTSSDGTVGGGEDNWASGGWATVGGGIRNRASGYEATVGGGLQNTANDSTATVGGGMENQANGAGATVGGGGWNGTSASGNHANGDASTVGGGWGNIITDTATYAVIGGGESNRAITNTHITVGGGHDNTASGEASIIGGGYSNQVSGFAATIAGGGSNAISSTGWAAAVGGGYNNRASGHTAAIPGGENNTAAGYYSFAAGRRAKANVDGCFVWGDSTNTDVACDTANAFVARTSGGATFYSNSGMTTGVRLDAGDGAWDNLSDRALKANVVPADGADVLARLASVPVSTWNYTSQDASVRHMGPMAQDFYAAFGLGEDERHIGTIDADGVALAAIQALAAQNARQQAEIDALKARLAALEAGGGR